MTVPACLIAPMMVWHTFPAVLGRSIGASSVSSSPHTVTLPAGIQAGDLILVIVAQDTTGALTLTDGGAYTEIFNDAGGAAMRLGACFRKATGGETTMNVTNSNDAIAWRAYRISGAADPATRAPEAATTSSNTGTAPNPPAVTPTGGIKKYLMIACYGNDTANTDPALTTYPTGYTQGGAVESTTASNCAMGSAEREAEVASENPTAFSIGASVRWAANVIAIHPS